MECKYIKPIKNQDAIELFQEQLGFKLPHEYISFIKINNGGRPDLNVIVLKSGVEKVVNKFLSFNESDKENIFSAKGRTEEDDKELVPFAVDPAGNYYCFKRDEVFFYNHEDGELQFAADSFSDFIGLLKE